MLTELIISHALRERMLVKNDMGFKYVKLLIFLNLTISLILKVTSCFYLSLLIQLNTNSTFTIQYQLCKTYSILTVFRV